VFLSSAKGFGAGPLVRLALGIVVRVGVVAEVVGRFALAFLRA